MFPTILKDGSRFWGLLWKRENSHLITINMVSGAQIQTYIA